MQQGYKESSEKKEETIQKRKKESKNRRKKQRNKQRKKENKKARNKPKKQIRPNPRQRNKYPMETLWTTTTNTVKTLQMATRTTTTAKGELFLIMTTFNWKKMAIQLMIRAMRGKLGTTITATTIGKMILIIPTTT